MTSALQSCRGIRASSPLHLHSQRGFSSVCLHPCRSSQKRAEIRTRAFMLGKSSGESRQQQTAIVAIDPSLASTSKVVSSGGPQVPALALAVVGAAGLLAVAFKKLKNKGVDETTGRYCVDSYLAKVMKDVNTVRIEDLSPEQIEAARARRSKERANHKLSLEEIELPQNHPFATRQVLSKEEYEQSLQNLRARSMRRRNYDGIQAGADGGHAGVQSGFGRRR
ncbi:hypothetical protein Vretimale_12555 [Volvox reticuliferus]|uniref:Uncharacterized protein n=1 Tax=Volvox reticuliferus TaxID=1737510 RepID=A0A8J4BUW4_9CHLO|nr:hypothetical protein Vretifemale_245 [Volvox reticuliferus]GIM08570.1 hypothetical protein Vretimale_12555 [Volvox reticuliferus]